MYWMAGIICLLYVILFFASKGEKGGKPPPGVAGLFYPMAVFLYRRACNMKLPFVNSRQVEKDLKELYPGMAREQLCEDYYVKKISLSLLLCIVGTLLGVAVTYSTQNQQMLKAGAILRGSYLEEAKELEVSTVLASGEKKQFQVTVHPRELSREEAEELYREFIIKLPSLVLGKNVSLEQVTSDLLLEESFADYPFSVEWKSSRLDILRSSGTVQPVEEAAEVTLTAMISYGRMEWQKELLVTVMPPVLSEEEMLEQEIAEILTTSESNSRAVKEWKLPANYQGEELVWKEEIQNNGSMFLVGAVIIAMLVFRLADKDLHDELAEKREVMKRKYPDVAQKLLLYLGAGMTVRAAFQKMASEYEEECQKGKTVQPVKKQSIYQEICYMCRELQTGVSEAVAYENFGRRVGVQEYLRLSTLLAQNLKKGNSTLLQRLREEAERASAERLQNSRKLGEEASTKLLLPMVLLLLVVMLIIMIPAFSSMGT